MELAIWHYRQTHLQSQGKASSSSEKLPVHLCPALHLPILLWDSLWTNGPTQTLPVQPTQGSREVTSPLHQCQCHHYWRRVSGPSVTRRAGVKLVPREKPQEQHHT